MSANATFIVLSYSARAYVQALVQAGYHAIALDAFADSDTQQLASMTIKLPYNKNGFDADVVRHTLQNLLANPAQYEDPAKNNSPLNIQGLLYGSGVEAQPDLLLSISSILPLIGNAPEVVARVKSYEFFQDLHALNIAHPQTSLIPLTQDGDARVLIKQCNGSGGTHIHYAGPDTPLSDYEYYQREIVGDCFGMLFVADAQGCECIGIHQQWPAQLPHCPMAASTMLGPVSIATSIQAQILHMAETLTQHYQLRGLNSLDVIVSEGRVFCLELNPRLSASMDLYQTLPALMDLHLIACQAKPAEQIVNQKNDSESIAADVSGAKENDQSLAIRAKKIIYAERDMYLANLSSLKNNEHLVPDWISDIPNTATIAQYQPICSLSAEADSAEQVMNLLEQRVQSLSEWLIKLQSSKN